MQSGLRNSTLNTAADKETVILTVFTPTYERYETLKRTYQSLCNQTSKSFIWMVVDDGSTDNTKETVQEWIEESPGFEIRYIYKSNGGMHTAHNTAYRNINTELNVCLDSDDIMPSDAVRLILDKWEEVRDKGYAGIIALDADLNSGKIIGKGFPEGMTETTVSGYYNSGGDGDKKLIYRTDIIRQYPEYPVFEGEKYYSLAYKYILIDQEYKMAVLDEVVCDVEYQPDGSTNSMFRQYLQNPNGFAHWRIVRMTYDTSWKRMVRDCIHYCSSSQIAKCDKYVSRSPYPLLTLLCIIPGRILTSYIRYKVELK